jgi:hypothetical protein
MRKEKFYVEFPDEETIQYEIHTIVNQFGNDRDSFFASLKNMYRQVGVKHLFRDWYETAFTLFMLVIIFTFTVLQSTNYFQKDIGNVYSFMFITSPLIYISFSFWALLDKDQTYEVEMVCKYNFYQLTAFRMLVYSILSVLLSLLGAAFLSIQVNRVVHFWELFTISISSLFIFSTLFIYVIIRYRSRRVFYGWLTAWVFLNCVLFIYSDEFYHTCLSQIPIYVYIFVVFLCGYLYVKQIQDMMQTTVRRREARC